MTGLVLVAVVLTLIGLGAAGWVRSPEQSLADRKPPAPTQLTAPVEQRVLRDTVVLRGEVGAARTFRISPAVPTAVDRAIVSGVRVHRGGAVREGQVLVEVSGRPVIALRGAVPAYRDLRPGDSGRDVVQLQKALRTLGLGTGGDRRGILGPGTKAAIGGLYRRVGFTAPEEGDPAALSSARTQIRQAERTRHEAELTLRRTRRADGGSDAEARRQVRYAQEDLNDLVSARSALAERTGPKLPMSEVAFLPDFPARVESMKARTGHEPGEPLLTVSSGELIVRGRVNAGQRGLLRTGMRVQLSSEVLGTTATGVLRSIGEPTTDDDGTRGHAVVVAPLSGKTLPRALAGQDVRLAVETAATEDKVLVVPAAAVIAGADGGLSVVRVDSGRERRVPITVGVSGNGYVEVVPVGAALGPGDRVVVGTDRSSGG